jgi:hypothetical protein
MAEYKMPKPIYFIGACALAAAAIFFGAQRASVPDRSSLEAAAMKRPAMSPLEIMTRYDKPLPIQTWDAS